MTENIDSKFHALSQIIDERLGKLNFHKKRNLEWRSSTEIPIQRVTLSLRKERGGQTGYVEAFAAFNFPDLELLCAHLKGTKVRKDFFTCSLNLGLLTEKKSMIEWPLSIDTDVFHLADAVAGILCKTVPPFFREFASLEDLLNHYRVKDRRICSGMECEWKQAAAETLLGLFEEAERTVSKIARDQPAMQQTVATAITEIRSRAISRD